MTSHPRTNQLRSSHVDTDGAEPKNSQNPKPRIVVLTGAGISAESGISTFRDANGMWEQHRIEDVASPVAFANNPDLVHRFYDARRAQLHEVRPNAAHWALSRLEAVFPGEVLIITQNVDDLHEQAMSENVLHMHGRLRSALCTACGASQEHFGNLIDRPACVSCGERALRPDVVWFGEEVREGARINEAVANCDVFAMIGTSGVVHPAAGLIDIAAANGAHTVLIDLDPDANESKYDIEYGGPASQSVPRWVREVMLRRGEGSIREHDVKPLGDELIRTINAFVQGERYGRGVDLGEDHVRRGLPELLSEFRLSTDEGLHHEAMYGLEPLLEELIGDNGNSGEGGSHSFAVHLMSSWERTGGILTELYKAQVENAADYIAWMIAEAGPIGDSIPEPGDLTWRVAQHLDNLSAEFARAGEPALAEQFRSGDLRTECTKESLPADLEGVLSIGMHLGIPLSFVAERERLIIEFILYEANIPPVEESARGIDNLLDIHREYLAAEYRGDGGASATAQESFEKRLGMFRPRLGSLALMRLLEAIHLLNVDEAAAATQNRMKARVT